jgi:hypothetical protein
MMSQSRTLRAGVFLPPFHPNDEGSSGHLSGMRFDLMAAFSAPYNLPAHRPANPTKEDAQCAIYRRYRY